MVAWMKSIWSSFSILVVLLSLVSVPSATARAAGEYVWDGEGYATPNDSGEDSQGPGYTSFAESADYSLGSTDAYGYTNASTSISSEGQLLYTSASVGASPFAEWDEWYEWEADPNDPNEVPPGGTLDFSFSGEGRVYGQGFGYDYGSVGSFVGSSSFSGVGGAGGLANPGGSDWGGGGASGAVGDFGYPSISGQWYPSGGYTSYDDDTPGWFEIGIEWEVSYSESDIVVGEGTSSISARVSCAVDMESEATAGWTGQFEGWAQGGAEGEAVASGDIPVFDFSSN